MERQGMAEEGNEQVEEAPGEEIAFLTAVDLVDAFNSHALSPVEVASALIKRAEFLNPSINAIVHIDPELTLAMARDAEARYMSGAPLSALDGVPITVKDLSAVAGWPRRRGSLALEPDKPDRHETPCVTRLREAGVVIIAKTATPEAGCKVVTRSAVHGVTRNPYDLTKTPGGSSGGAAAALASGLGPLAVGSDGAGSIRIPASHTNVFGLKPGFGRIPAFPPDIDMPHSVVGPMARTVGDATLMLAIMSRPDPRDPYAWPIPFEMPPYGAGTMLSDLRIAFSARLGCTAPIIDAEVDECVAEAAPLLAHAGAELSHVDPIWPIDPYEPFKIFWETACSATVDGFAPDKQALLDPLLLKVAQAGRATSVADYQRALEQRMAIAVAAKIFFNRFDLLVGPVMPVPPYAAELNVPENLADEDWRWCPYTYPWNMTGQPAASVPIAFTRAGLPIGVQIIGRMGEEATVLRAAMAIERQRPLYKQQPRFLTSPMKRSG